MTEVERKVKIFPKHIKFVELGIPTSSHLSRNTSLLVREKIMKYLRDERNVPILFLSWNSQSQCKEHLVQ